MPSIFGFAASKQPSRRRRTRRLAIEGLEDRALMSITSTIDITSIAQNSETGQNHTDESTSSGGSTSAVWTIGSDSVSAQASGSVTTDGLSLSGSASNSTDEQGSGHPYMAGVASVYFYTTITVATRSTVYFDLTPQFTHSPDHTARGGLSLIQYGSSTQELIDVVDRDLDGLSGTQITKVLDLTAGTYTFRTAIYSVAEKNDYAPTGPQSSSLGLSIIEVPQTVPTTTTLTIAPNPSVYGQPVTLSATVAANGSGLPAPTGKVTFLDGSDVIGSGDIDASGKVSVTTTKLAFGTHLITAAYAGDANNDPSTSQTLPMAVNPLVSLDQLKAIMPSLTPSDAQRYLQPLNDALVEFQINTPKRIAAFLSQIAVESNDLNRWEEQYSNLGQEVQLRSDRPSHINVGDTADARKSDYFNYWYSGVNGNGDYESNDGYTYRGRGPIQLTGRSNYQQAGAALGVDLIANPDLVSISPSVGLRVAAWYFSNSGANAIADTVDPNSTASINNVGRQITFIVNGAYRQLLERQNRFKTALRFLIVSN